MISNRRKFARKSLSIILILTLCLLNYVGYRVTKSYISKSSYQEVEELTDTDEGSYKGARIIGWTYEYFKSFRNPTKK